MSKLDLLKMAYNNLWRRKVRTFLTVLGVIIGTTSIVVMLSLGIGLDQANKSQMERWGSLNVIQVSEGMTWDEEGNPKGEGKSLDLDAVNEMKNIEGITSVMPGFTIYAQASWGKRNGSFELVGLDAEEMSKYEFEIDKGRLLNQDDRAALILGAEIGNNFRTEKEIEMLNKEMSQGGEYIKGENKTNEMLNERLSLQVTNGNQKMKRYNFHVVGTLTDKYADKAWSAYAPIEDVKRIKEFMEKGQPKDAGGDPFSKGQNKKKKKGMSYDFVWLRTDNVEDTKRASQEIKDLGYNAYAMADYLDGIEQGSRVIQGILGGIGSITLLVAALGIINTMIMSIYERTREIGIMKVIGASFSDIRILFLTEAGLIGLTGGVVGLFLSYAISTGINYVSADFINQGMDAGTEVALSLIPPWLIIFALVFSLSIGVIAGVYPANKAVKLSPINAIRNE